MSLSRLQRAFLLPAQLTMIILVALPLLIVAAYSLLTRGTYGGVVLPWTAEAYGRAFDWLYLQIIWRSVWISAVSTGLCLVLAFPLAFYITRYARNKTMMLNMVTLPFWTSFLVRTYAWMFLLRDTGFLNSVLTGLGWIDSPLPLLFNPIAVIVGLTYGYVPFMVFPIYATLEKLDPALLEAAEDLGAKPAKAAWRIAVPLAAPGIAAGCLLVFIPCLGAYLTPDLMGGGRTVMLGNVVQNQFTSARDWPFGAAISILFLLLTLVASQFLKKRGEELI
jgi:spermidine/putrescine transport system permease protein